MAKQGKIIKSGIKTMVFDHISGWVHQVDNTIFRMAVHYIMKNFDPTGISIPGMIDSFCNVLIKPKMLLFSKKTISSKTYYKEFARKFWQPLVKTASASSCPVLMLHA